jgi:hypothetical protein
VHRDWIRRAIAECFTQVSDNACKMVRLLSAFDGTTKSRMITEKIKTFLALERSLVTGALVCDALARRYMVHIPITHRTHTGISLTLFAIHLL